MTTCRYRNIFRTILRQQDEKFPKIFRNKYGLGKIGGGEGAAVAVIVADIAPATASIVVVLMKKTVGCFLPLQSQFCQ